MTKLSDVASVLRSKNAGPFVITVDVIFPDSQTHAAVMNAGKLTPDTVAGALGLQVSDLLFYQSYDALRTVKFSFRRAVSSGSAGDSDVYGAQQYAPLSSLVVL